MTHFKNAAHHTFRAILLCFIGFGAACANDADNAATDATVLADASESAIISTNEPLKLVSDEERIAAVYGGVDASDVTPSPIPGLYEMVLNGGVYYVSADGTYLVAGTMFKIDENGQTDLTEPRRGAIRKKIIDGVDTNSMIVYKPDGETKHTITVFTDTSCHYCRELHKQMAGYNNLGIEVRYMAYPRRGPNSPDAQVMESVWCADNPQTAMDTAKARRPLDEKSCGAPIAQHYQVGKEVGVTGTPAVVTDTGKLIPGFRPPLQMLQALNDKS